MKNLFEYILFLILVVLCYIAVSIVLLLIFTWSISIKWISLIRTVINYLFPSKNNKGS